MSEPGKHALDDAELELIGAFMRDVAGRPVTEREIESTCATASKPTSPVTLAGNPIPKARQACAGQYTR